MKDPWLKDYPLSVMEVEGLGLPQKDRQHLSAKILRSSASMIGERVALLLLVWFWLASPKIALVDKLNPFRPILVFASGAFFAVSRARCRRTDHHRQKMASRLWAADRLDC